LRNHPAAAVWGVEAVVRRFYEEMNNGRKNDLAEELFTADHIMHDLKRS
jgi:hypothetical protein